MRIAQVAPLYERVPPVSYGGTERVVSYLTEALVAQGHNVTLFASGDSITDARLVPAAPRSLRLAGDVVDQQAHHVRLLDLVSREAGAFDVIHFHIDYLHFPLSRLARWRQVTTLHGRLDIPDLQPLYRQFKDMPLVSISDDQRTPIPWANWRGTVYHGLPRDLYAPREGRGGYLAFVGRISPEKRVDRAISIARGAGWPLRVAAKIDDADAAYFEAEVRPLLGQPGVEFIGEIGEDEKNAFIGDAAALLFPIDWCEPFGLVMIEAMACGTPVVAWRRGSVAEVVRDGLSGFVVDSIEEAVAAVGRIGELDRRECRREFERRFDADLMARRYLEIYAELKAPEARAQKRQPAAPLTGVGDA